MRVITISQDFIFSQACTDAMLFEIATHKDFGGMTQAAANKLAEQQLNKASGGKGGKSNGVGDLPLAKLRTVLVNKLQNNPDIAQVFKEGNLQFEMQHLQEETMASAGANKQRGTRAPSRKLQGEYVVVRKDGLKCTAETDPGKWDIWQHVWECNNFEQYFAKAPKKSVTRTGRVITASSEMLWAVKCGWVKPTNTEQQ